LKTLHIKVKPNAKQQKIAVGEGDFWIVHLKSPPVDGKANAELIDLLSKFLKVPKSSIQIKSGQTSKFKRIEIDGEIEWE
jgi:uncharacterized protein (TIGR00251 family)